MEARSKALELSADIAIYDKKMILAFKNTLFRLFFD